MKVIKRVFECAAAISLFALMIGGIGAIMFALNKYLPEIVWKIVGEFFIGVFVVILVMFPVYILLERLNTMPNKTSVLAAEERASVEKNTK